MIEKGILSNKAIIGFDLRILLTSSDKTSLIYIIRDQRGESNVTRIKVTLRAQVSTNSYVTKRLVLVRTTRT